MLNHEGVVPDRGAQFSCVVFEEQLLLWCLANANGDVIAYRSTLQSVFVVIALDMVRASDGKVEHVFRLR